VFRFLNNNDTGERFVTRYGIERTRVAAAMLMTLPGIPGLYTGDEVGAAFQPYDEGPPIAWRDPHGLRDWYKRLIALRRDHPALRSPHLRFIDVGANTRVLAYVRQTEEAERSLLVLLNYGAIAERVVVPPDVSTGPRLRDLITNNTFDVSASGGAVEVEPYGVLVLTRE
jgi:glycosidase